MDTTDATQTTAPAMYDTLAAVRRLTAAGLSEKQAEGVVYEQVHLLEHNFATKAQVAQLQAKLEADIERAKSSIIKWVVGLNLATILAMFSMVVAIILNLP